MNNLRPGGTIKVTDIIHNITFKVTRTRCASIPTRAVISVVIALVFYDAILIGHD